MITNAVWNGIIWSVLWIAYVYMLLKCFPWEMVHEYPEDIKQKTTLEEPTDEQKKKAKLYGGLASVVLFAVLAVLQKHAGYLFTDLLLYLDHCLHLECRRPHRCRLALGLYHHTGLADPARDKRMQRIQGLQISFYRFLTGEYLYQYCRSSDGGTRLFDSEVRDMVREQMIGGRIDEIL